MIQSEKTVSPMSNASRNKYVVEHITSALLELMREKPLRDVSISELCDAAGVGRASFYRNFSDKEDVISRYLKQILDDWWLRSITKPDFNIVRAIFEHFYERRELYMLLYSQGLSHLHLNSITDACGPKPEQENHAAYTSAFFAHGLYGWIDEWFKRGTPESPEEMAALFENAQNSLPH